MVRNAKKKGIPATAASFDEFFALDTKKWQEDIYGQFGFLSNSTVHAAGTVWGLPYVYDFLRDLGLITETTQCPVKTFV